MILLLGRNFSKVLSGTLWYSVRASFSSCLSVLASIMQRKETGIFENLLHVSVCATWSYIGQPCESILFLIVEQIEMQRFSGPRLVTWWVVGIKFSPPGCSEPMFFLLQCVLPWYCEVSTLAALFQVLVLNCCLLRWSFTCISNSSGAVVLQLVTGEKRVLLNWFTPSPNSTLKNQYNS